MPRRAEVDTIALESMLRTQERIATHAQLVEVGIPKSSVTYRIRPGGPWQRIFPGVVLAHNGRPTRRETLLGAVTYAGDGAMITGLLGLQLHGVKAASPRRMETPHVLVPRRSRRTAHHLAVIERCRQPPDALSRQGVPVAPVAKCLVDAARRELLLDVVRELVAECIQQRKCSVEDLRREVFKSARQRSGFSRLALAEMEAGVRSVAEARIRKAVIASDLPIPLFNPSLFTWEGEFIASPDGYFPHCAAGWEVDSFAYHFRRGSYLRTQRRLRRTAVHGVLLIGISPVDAIENPGGFLAELRGFIDMAARRALPDIVVRPA